VPKVAEEILVGKGRLEEYVSFLRRTIQPSQAKSIAQTVAKYINSAGLRQLARGSGYSALGWVRCSGMTPERSYRSL
jgi:hypothetical protein